MASVSDSIGCASDCLSKIPFTTGIEITSSYVTTSSITTKEMESTSGLTVGTIITTSAISVTSSSSSSSSPSSSSDSSTQTTSNLMETTSDINKTLTSGYIMQCGDLGMCQHGSCINNACECFNGWGGINCDSEINANSKDDKQ